MTMKTRLTFIALLFTLPFYGQQLINGSFESNNAISGRDTFIYTSNIINNFYLLKGKNFTELKQSVACQSTGKTASDSIWYLKSGGVGFDNSSKQTADFLMELTSGLVPTIPYTVTFEGIGATGQELVLIGVTNDTTNIGTIKDSVLVDTATCWKTYNSTFIPGTQDKYISVKIITNDPGNWPTILVSLDNFRISQGTAIKEESRLTFKLYPNPSDGIYQIYANSNIKSIKVFDITGKIIIEKLNINTSQDYIDISEHQEGLYFVRLIDENGNSSVEKLMKH